MSTVSDELVERVANVIDDGMLPRSDCERYAREAITALSSPEFARAILDGLSDEERATVVMPLAEEMLRKRSAMTVRLAKSGGGATHVTIVISKNYEISHLEGATLLDACRERGE